MGFLDDLLGNTAADASKKAAADTYAKQQAATAQLQGQGAQYATDFGNLGTRLGGLGGNFQPWENTGSTANDAVARLMANPDSIRSLPGYQPTLDAGTRALDHSATANGNLFSGKAGKALVGYGQGLFDKTYGDQLARLLGVSQQGLDATGRSVATQGAGIQMQGQGLTGQLGANTSAYGGNMTSAGTIGQGDIAAANAQSQGAQNLLNTGVSLAGMAFGMPPGMGSVGKLFGAGGSGGSFGSLFGGGSPTGYGR